jgi:hypothetical protein
VERSREVKTERNKILLWSWRPKISWVRVLETSTLLLILYVVTSFANPVTAFYCAGFAFYKCKKAFRTFVGLDKRK